MVLWNFSKNNIVFYNIGNLKKFIHKWTRIRAPVDKKNIFKKYDEEGRMRNKAQATRYGKKTKESYQNSVIFF